MTFNQWFWGLMLLTAAAQLTAILVGVGAGVGFLMVILIIIGWCQIEPRP